MMIVILFFGRETRERERERERTDGVQVENNEKGSNTEILKIHTILKTNTIQKRKKWNCTISSFFLTKITWTLIFPDLQIQPNSVFSSKAVLVREMMTTKASEGKATSDLQVHSAIVVVVDLLRLADVDLVDDGLQSNNSLSLRRIMLMNYYDYYYSEE